MSDKQDGPSVPTHAGITVSPAPAEDEVAAIMAAYEALWPKPFATDATKGAPPRWRFSGRWWNKPVPRSSHG